MSASTWAKVDHAEAGRSSLTTPLSRAAAAILIGSGETEDHGLLDFDTIWNRFHSGHAPVAHLMRHTGAKHWVRFHSLPESKRYADNDDEVAVVLQRSHAMADLVLGDAPAWLVQGRAEWPDMDEPIIELSDSHATIREFGLQPSPHIYPEGDEDEPAWRPYAARVQWVADRFTPLLRRCAEDLEGPTLWISEATGGVFAPYDGGADLFLPTVDEVARAKTRWPDWLSSHPAGL